MTDKNFTVRRDIIASAISIGFIAGLIFATALWLDSSSRRDYNKSEANSAYELCIETLEKHKQ